MWGLYLGMYMQWNALWNLRTPYIIIYTTAVMWNFTCTLFWVTMADLADVPFRSFNCFLSPSFDHEENYLADESCLQILLLLRYS